MYLIFLKNICSYYLLYIDSLIIIKNKKIIFSIKKMGTTIQNLKLEDFGINEFGKSQSGINIAKDIMKHLQVLRLFIY